MKHQNINVKKQTISPPTTITKKKLILKQIKTKIFTITSTKPGSKLLWLYILHVSQSNIKSQKSPKKSPNQEKSQKNIITS